MTNKKSFGSFIRAKRTEKDLSQKDLAEALFVTEGAVSKWERGISYPDITLITDICRILEISEHELITASTDTDTRKMKQEARKFRAIRSTWFWVPTVCYVITLTACFICNLAVNRTLSWFFVVLAALVCAFTFVPTVCGFFESNKLLAFTVSSCLAICLLLLTCAVYTADLSWCLTACIGVLMGYVMLFTPILLSKTKFARYKYILCFSALFLLTVLMLLHIRLRQPYRLGSAFLMAAYSFAPVIACAAICALRMNVFFKAGSGAAVIGTALYCANYAAAALFGPADSKPYHVNFQNWEQCLQGNIQFLVFMLFLLVSVILLAAGFFSGRRIRRQSMAAENSKSAQ